MPDTASTRPRRARPAPKAAATEASRSPLTPEHWIGNALDLLVDGGIEHVRVDVVAKNLAVTRGSFYWHFKDRNELLMAMLESWRNSATDQIIERFERQRSGPEGLLKDLLSLPFRGRAAQRAARVEVAIRDWARRDPMARRALDDVDARRLSHIGACFTALGFGDDEARSRAFMLYAYEVAESLLFNQGTAAQKTARSRLAEQLLTAPLTVKR